MPGSRTDLLLHHLLQLGSVLRVAHHPLEGLGIPHTFWQVWIQQLLHCWVLHKSFSRRSFLSYHLVTTTFQTIKTEHSSSPL